MYGAMRVRPIQKFDRGQKDADDSSIRVANAGGYREETMARPAGYRRFVGMVRPIDRCRAFGEKP
jgi:hypothetical protein